MTGLLRQAQHTAAQVLRKEVGEVSLKEGGIVTDSSYEQKAALFEKLKRKGLFWSYSDQLQYSDAVRDLLVEHTLKYADFDDITRCKQIFGGNTLQKVWEKTMKYDRAFLRTNLMLARVFFGMDVESEFFRKAKNERFEKLKLFASEDTRTASSTDRGM